MSQEPIAADQPPPKPGPVRLAKGQEVSLGCGTLILIAIIVLLCSGWRNRDVDAEVRGLRADIKQLQQSVDTQTRLIIQLKQDLEKKNGEK